MKSINDFVVDIFNQIFDEKGLHPIENMHLKTLCYRLTKTNEEFTEEVHKVIAQGIGDGFAVEINCMKDMTFVRIEIFDREDFGYISDYLKNNGKEIDYPHLISQNYNNLIELSRFDESQHQYLINELTEKFGEKVNVTHSVRIFEKGASDWQVNLLLWISSIPASMIGNYIYNLLKNRSFNDTEVRVIDNFNKKDVLQKAASICEVNPNDLRIIEFYYDEHEETTFYFITSRYVDLKITLDKSNNITKYSVDKKTQTEI